MSKVKQPGYAEAIAEIEKILEKFDQQQMDIDRLAAEVKRAGELIDLCRRRLRKAEEDVARVLKDGEREQ